VVDTDPRVNLVGVGIGSKLRGARILRRRVIHFYVAHKLPEPAIPAKHRLPRTIAGVETDVIETGRFHASSTVRIRPARPGCSIGATQGVRSTFGTLGALVQKLGGDGATFVLSCNHVLANWGTFDDGTDILQQANIDEGLDPEDLVASLVHAHPLSPSMPNVIDAAIAAVADASAVRSDILAPIGKLTSGIPIDAVEKMVVEKVGRSSDHTTGTVIATSADFSVSSGDPDIGSFSFQNQILIRAEGGAFSKLGDSGALVVDRASKRATGLLCASSDTQPITSACHMRDVLRLLGLVLVP
jgi:hypothetical protein